MWYICTINNFSYVWDRHSVTEALSESLQKYKSRHKNSRSILDSDKIAR